VDDCFVTPAFAETERGRELIVRLDAANVKISEVGEHLFRTIADTSNSQGIILIAERLHEGRTAIERNLQLSSTALVVYLHEISDPSNLGAVFRTAEAAGVAGIIVSEDSANVFSPKALRAAMGASLRVPVWENADLSEVISWSRANGLRTTAADIGAETAYTEIDWKQSRLIIFGSEAHGLNRKALEIVDETMLIPMQNGVESLNLAVSAGIILFEAVRQKS
jgi:TrmH family RNA methyltransferase